MQVSKTLDYAVRSLIHLAKTRMGTSTIKDISAEQHIPQNYLAKIMRKLVQRGILRSTPGPDGGYTLKRKARDISLKDIYEAIEGDMQLIDCMDKTGVCELFDACSQRSIWDHLQLNTLKFLSNVTLNDITQNDFKDLDARLNK